MYIPRSHVQNKELSKAFYRYTYMYINNYNIFLDTILRMLVMWKKLYLEWKRDHCFEKIVIFHDYTIDDVPQKYKVWSYILNGDCNEEALFKSLMIKLKAARFYLTENEKDDYDIWMDLLCRKFPGEVDFSWHYAERYYDDHVKKRKFVKDILLLIGLTQMQLSHTEIFHCWEYVLSVIVSNFPDVRVICNESNTFDMNIAKICKGKTLFVCEEFDAIPDIVFYNFKRKYYWKSNKEPPKVLSSMQARVWNAPTTTLLEHFKMCDKECNNRILDINDYMTTEMFKNLGDTYVKNTIDTIFPDYYDEDEYSWVTINIYETLVPKIKSDFERLFEMKLI